MFSVVTLKPRRLLTVEEKAACDAEKALIARNIRLAETEAFRILNVALDRQRVQMNLRSELQGDTVSRNAKAARDAEKALMEATRFEREKAAYLSFKADIAALKVRLAASL
jgi:hypothetical protein